MITQKEIILEMIDDLRRMMESDRNYEGEYLCYLNSLMEIKSEISKL